jgi:hypothetical protein
MSINGCVHQLTVLPEESTILKITLANAAIFAVGGIFERPITKNGAIVPG